MLDEESRTVCDLSGSSELQQLKQVANAENVNRFYLCWTPLMKAAMVPNDGGLQCAEHLLRAGARPETAASTGTTAMHWAAQANSVGVMRLLHRRDPRLCLRRNRRGDSPLAWATPRRTEAALLLLSWGADPTVGDENGCSPLQTARDANCWTLYCGMLEWHRRQPLSDEEKETIMQEAERIRRLCSSASECNLQQLQQLANAENCNEKSLGCTPLMLAAAATKDSGIECVKFLLELGADASARDQRGMNAAHHAAKSDNAKVLSLLPSHCLTVTDSDGRTPLELAAHSGKLKAVKLLLKNGKKLKSKRKRKISEKSAESGKDVVDAVGSCKKTAEQEGLHVANTAVQDELQDLLLF